MSFSTDLEKGKYALTVFHNASTRFASYPFKSVDQLFAAYGKKADIYCDGLGLAISSNGLTMTQVNIAMNSLAGNSQGRIPKDHNSYFAAIQGQAGKIDYLDLTKTVVGDVVEAGLDGAQALGDNLLFVMKVANFVMPFATLYFAYLFLRHKAKGLKK